MITRLKQDDKKLLEKFPIGTLIEYDRNSLSFGLGLIVKIYCSINHNNAIIAHVYWIKSSMSRDEYASNLRLAQID